MERSAAATTTARSSRAGGPSPGREIGIFGDSHIARSGRDEHHDLHPAVAAGPHRILRVRDDLRQLRKTYGAFAGIIVLLFWLWITSYAVLLGAEINAGAEQQTIADTTRGPAELLGQRNARQSRLHTAALLLRPVGLVAGPPTSCPSLAAR